MTYMMQRSATDRSSQLTHKPHSEIIEQLQSILAGAEPIRPASSEEVGRPPTVMQIRQLRGVRAGRATFFKAELFADPAWDMLLELYGAELGQRHLSVTSLGLASGVPATTALRWTAALQRAGLIERHNDPLDARRSLVSLSHLGLEAMDSYFGSLPTLFQAM